MAFGRFVMGKCCWQMAATMYSVSVFVFLLSRLYYFLADLGSYTPVAALQSSKSLTRNFPGTQMQYRQK